MVNDIDKLAKAEQQKIAEEKSNLATKKSPPYITVGNGLATKQFPADVSVDAFEVFNQLSKAQRGLFIKFKNILVQQNFDNWINKEAVDNPNIVYLSGIEDHDTIRAEMSKNRNGTELEEKAVLKKIRNNVYMLNPYIFIPASSFGKIASEWHALPSKRKKPTQTAKQQEDQL